METKFGPKTRGFLKVLALVVAVSLLFSLVTIIIANTATLKKAEYTDLIALVNATKVTSDGIIMARGFSDGFVPTSAKTSATPSVTRVFSVRTGVITADTANIGVILGTSVASAGEVQGGAVTTTGGANLDTVNTRATTNATNVATNTVNIAANTTGKLSVAGGTLGGALNGTTVTMAGIISGSGIVSAGDVKGTKMVSGSYTASDGDKGISMGVGNGQLTLTSTAYSGYIHDKKVLQLNDGGLVTPNFVDHSDLLNHGINSHSVIDGHISNFNTNVDVRITAQIGAAFPPLNRTSSNLLRTIIALLAHV